MHSTLPDDILFDIIELLSRDTLQQVENALPLDSMWCAKVKDQSWRHMRLDPREDIGALQSLLTLLQSGTGKHVRTVRVQVIFRQINHQTTSTPDVFLSIAPDIFRELSNLRSLVWIWDRYPDQNTLEAIASLDNLRKVHIGGTYTWPDRSAELAQFFRIIGPQLTEVKLYGVGSSFCSTEIPIFAYYCTSPGHSKSVASDKFEYTLLT